MDKNKELYVVLDYFNEYQTFSNIEDVKRYIENMGGKKEICGVFIINTNANLLNEIELLGE